MIRFVGGLKWSPAVVCCFAAKVSHTSDDPHSSVWSWTSDWRLRLKMGEFAEIAHHTFVVTVTCFFTEKEERTVVGCVLRWCVLNRTELLLSWFKHGLLSTWTRISRQWASNQQSSSKLTHSQPARCWCSLASHAVRGRWWTKRPNRHSQKCPGLVFYFGEQLSIPNTELVKMTAISPLPVEK